MLSAILIDFSIPILRNTIKWSNSFGIGILGQVWYLIVSIPDLCNLTYFDPDLSWKFVGPDLYSNFLNVLLIK